MPKLETRDLALPASLDEGAGNRLVGYIAKFNMESHPLFDRDVVKDAPFVEVIAPGAFSRTLRENPDIPALVNHNSSAVLGRTSSGTLQLTEDEVGLAFSLDLPDTTLGRDSKETVRRRDIVGCSFGMFVIVDNIIVRQDAPILRTVLDVDLFEISPLCTVPAYSASEVELRSKQTIRHEVGATFPGMARARRRLLIEG